MVKSLYEIFIKNQACGEGFSVFTVTTTPAKALKKAQRKVETEATDYYVTGVKEICELDDWPEV